MEPYSFGQNFLFVLIVFVLNVTLVQMAHKEIKKQSDKVKNKTEYMAVMLTTVYGGYFSLFCWYLLWRSDVNGRIGQILAVLTTLLGLSFAVFTFVIISQDSLTQDAREYIIYNAVYSLSVFAFFIALAREIRSGNEDTPIRAFSRILSKTRTFFGRILTFITKPFDVFNNINLLENIEELYKYIFTSNNKPDGHNNKTN